jgi:hypothetical protein
MVKTRLVHGKIFAKSIDQNGIMIFYKSIVIIFLIIPDQLKKNRKIYILIGFIKFG